MLASSQISDSSVLAHGENLGGKTIRYQESTKLRLETFSYLPGCDLFHKISVTCKSIRSMLPNSGLLDQIKVITIKAPSDNYPDYLPVDSFKYALELADSIQIQVNAYHLKYAKLIFNIIQLTWGCI